MDIFDRIRCTLWQNRHEERSILTGCVWRSEWINTPGGVINKIESSGVFGHALKIFGWKQINNEPYLIAQLSNGINNGDNGIFYFSRTVVNQAFTFNAFTFSDLEKEEAQYYISKGRTRPNHWLSRILIRLWA